MPDNDFDMDARSDNASLASDQSGGDVVNRGPLRESRDRRVADWVSKTVKDLDGRTPGGDGSALPDYDAAIPAEPAGKARSSVSTAYYTANSDLDNSSADGMDNQLDERSRGRESLGR